MRICAKQRVRIDISGGRELPECISVKCEFVGTSSAPSDEITGISCAILLDEHIFDFSGNQFRSEYDSHLYELMTRVFWSEEK